MAVYRIFVEKKSEFAVEAGAVLSDLKQSLGNDAPESVRIINRYDVENITENDFNSVRNTIFSEPQVDFTYDEMPECKNARVFAVEFLPGQFDQRADSCAQCIQISTQKERPTVRTAKVYVLGGNISDKAFDEIKSYLINPVECREACFCLDSLISVPIPVHSVFRYLHKRSVLQYVRQRFMCLAAI